MLAKIISALALTLLLTGGASAFIPQPQESLQTELVAAEPAQPEQSLQTELSVAAQHNIYAGHSNSVEAQESFPTQLFAVDTILSDPRQFD
jgi:hypothetical protein